MSVRERLEANMKDAVGCVASLSDRSADDDPAGNFEKRSQGLGVCAASDKKASIRHGLADAP